MLSFGPWSARDVSLALLLDHPLMLLVLVAHQVLPPGSRVMIVGSDQSREESALLRDGLCCLGGRRDSFVVSNRDGLDDELAAVLWTSGRLGPTTSDDNESPWQLRLLAPADDKGEVGTTAGDVMARARGEWP